MAKANITISPAFTWLFLATYADPKSAPVVLRTQADTEETARAQLAGDYALTFAAKIRTESPIMATWADHDNFTLWTLNGTSIRESLQQMTGGHHA